MFDSMCSEWLAVLHVRCNNVDQDEEGKMTLHAWFNVKQPRLALFPAFDDWQSVKKGSWLHRDPNSPVGFWREALLLAIPVMVVFKPCTQDVLKAAAKVSVDYD